MKSPQSNTARLCHHQLLLTQAPHTPHYLLHMIPLAVFSLDLTKPFDTSMLRCSDLRWVTSELNNTRYGILMNPVNTGGSEARDVGSSGSEEDVEKVNTSYWQALNSAAGKSS
jgi:hypothetical protein